MIADLLGFHKSTIYREIRRNQSLDVIYRAREAQTRSSRRYKRCRKRKVIQGKIKQTIFQCLTWGWSPEQISGRVRREYKKGPSHQTIYNYIYYAGLRGYLRNNGKRGAGRYIQRRRIREIRNGLHINKRPEIANTRRRIGDWERDTMHTYGGTQILVCQDRKSRLVKMRNVVTRTTMEVGKLTEKLIKETGKKAFTVTNDNGGDFKGKSKIKIPIYFCEPMKPQQRGSVENIIGVIREYISRKTDISKYRTKDFKMLEQKLNLRPRKVLDFKTPIEVYYDKNVALEILI